MQINIDDTTIDWEFKKAKRYLPVRLSTTFFDEIGNCIAIVANRADGQFTDIIENSKSEVFLTLMSQPLFDEIKSKVLNMDYWFPTGHFNTVNGLADNVKRKIHLDGYVF